MLRSGLITENALLPPSVITATYGVDHRAVFTIRGIWFNYLHLGFFSTDICLSSLSRINKIIIYIYDISEERFKFTLPQGQICKILVGFLLSQGDATSLSY